MKRGAVHHGDGVAGVVAVRHVPQQRQKHQVAVLSFRAPDFLTSRTTVSSRSSTGFQKRQRTGWENCLRTFRYQW